MTAPVQGAEKICPQAAEGQGRGKSNVESRKRLTIYLINSLNNWLNMLTRKPNAIIITVRDKKQNKSKSKSVYYTTVDEVCKKLEKVVGRFE